MSSIIGIIEENQELYKPGYVDDCPINYYQIAERMTICGIHKNLPFAFKSRKPTKRSRKCLRGRRKSDGKCKRKPGRKSRKTKK